MTGFQSEQLDYDMYDPVIPSTVVHWTTTAPLLLKLIDASISLIDANK